MSEPTHDDLIAAAEPEVRERLQAIQAEVERRVAGAERCVSYKMPAYRLRRVFFYFAGFKKHVGVYPPVEGPEALMARLAPYRGPKGNLIFPHKEPLPVDLIGEAAERLAEQYG
ncbi:iron chaperone [Brevundimonas staleyi]|uniref:Iron chaperone n=1 Tax=Brevundimonas staleyi TaxID=74326 RepID=A0ABW0FY35_9CAUL